MNLKNGWLLFVVAGVISAFCGASVRAADVPVNQSTVELERLAISQFAAFGKAMGIAPAELQMPTVKNYGTFLTARSAKWEYRTDVGGNQVFKATSNLSNINETSNSKTNPKASDGYTTKIVDTTRHYASVLDSDKSLVNSVIKRELLVISQCRDVARTRIHEGRYLVRLGSSDWRNYFDVIFDRNMSPVRIDTNIQTAVTTQISELLFETIHSGRNASIVRDNRGNITIGTFFSMSEARFELDAYSFEGEQFLSQYTPENPFTRDFVKDATLQYVDLDHVYRATQDYRWWTYQWWKIAGEVGGVRGNWNDVSKSWQNEQANVVHHSLGDYDLVGGEPTETKTDILFDQRPHAVPFAISKTLAPSFYTDLENCTIGAFFTHAGTIQNALQFARGRGIEDVWFKLGNEKSKLGSGNLRHIFFHSCSTMGAFREKVEGHSTYLTLFEEWLSARYINGVRTICGVDGESIGGSVDGWHFFKHYNQGDSISDSWILAMIDDFNLNCPAVVSYGSTRDEALAILSDGRFSSQRAEPNWAVASVWVDPTTIPKQLNPPTNAIWLDTLDVSKAKQDFGSARARWSIGVNNLSVAGKKYQQGVGTHAESKFAIDLKGIATRFTATVGVDDEGDSQKGSVVFEVWVDNQLVAQSPLMKKGKNFDFDVDLTGAKMLGLLVTDGGDGGDSDHADWCDALLYLDTKATEKPEAMDIIEQK